MARLEKIAIVIFWTGLFLIFLWLLAKATGLINTALWLEMFPYMAGVISFGSGAFALCRPILNLGKSLQKISYLEIGICEIKRDVKDIKSGIKDMKQEMADMKLRLSLIEKDVGIMKNEISFIKKHAKCLNIC